MRELILLHAEYDLDVESIEHRGSTYHQDVSDLTEILSVTARLVWMGGPSLGVKCICCKLNLPKDPKAVPFSQSHVYGALAHVFVPIFVGLYCNVPDTY